MPAKKKTQEEKEAAAKQRIDDAAIHAEAEKIEATARENQRKADKKKEKVVARTEKCSHMLRVPLTEAEILDYAGKAADAQQAITVIAEELQSIKDEFKSRSQSEIAALQKFSSFVREKYEVRDVECERLFDYANAIVRTTRLDTGVTFKERKMTDDELQTEIDFE